jgi:hypothetical protein
VIAYNAGHEHQGDAMDGKTPDVVFAEQLATKRTCDARLLDMLCLRRIDKTSSGAPLRIGQNGIAYKGLRYGQYEPSLAAWAKRSSSASTMRTCRKSSSSTRTTSSSASRRAT